MTQFFNKEINNATSYSFCFFSSHQPSAVSTFAPCYSDFFNPASAQGNESNLIPYGSFVLKTVPGESLPFVIGKFGARAVRPIIMATGNAGSSMWEALTTVASKIYSFSLSTTNFILGARAKDCGIIKNREVVGLTMGLDPVTGKKVLLPGPGAQVDQDGDTRTISVSGIKASEQIMHRGHF